MTFRCGAHAWNLLLCPNHLGSLALFLAVAQPESLPPGWSRNTQFELQVLAPGKRTADGQPQPLVTWRPQPEVFYFSSIVIGLVVALSHKHRCIQRPL